MQTLAQRVELYIRKHKLLKAGDRVGAAVSGGADSVAMLRLLLELRGKIGLVLSVVHFNHKLRGAESDADEKFVAELARSRDLEFHGDSGDVARHAADERVSLETAAKHMRYAFFSRLMDSGLVDRIATAHTLDDQAETVLMKLARGAGTRGLAGIYPVVSLQSLVVGSRRVESSIVRPLLGFRRSELESYLTGLGQGWREDASNRDLRHTRNRVRHGILPRLEEHLNPAIREALGEAAEIARAEEEYWEGEVTSAWERLRQVTEESGRGGTAVNLAGLAALPLALQRRVLRAAAESVGLPLEFRHVEEILEVVKGNGKSATLPAGWAVSRIQGALRFERNDPTSNVARDYQIRLSVPGFVNVSETGTRFEALLEAGNHHSNEDAAYGYDPARIGKELIVRNWHAGDRFWPAHTKGPKKIKELLQEKHLPELERKLWPVVVSNDEIIWVRGFPAPAAVQAKPGEQAVLIRENRL